MNLEQIRALYDVEERRDIEYPDLERQVLPHVVRQISRSGLTPTIIHSSLSAGNADAVIRQQIAWARMQGHGLEWKLYDYDAPPDLSQRLLRHGFAADDEGAILALDLAKIPPALAQPLVHDVRRLTRAEQVERDMGGVLSAVWQMEFKRLVRELSETLERLPDQVSIYVAYIDGAPAATARSFFAPHSRFVSLWAGSTLPEQRGRGLYTALLAARLQEAAARGRQFAVVEAGPMSRPILEKHGFVCIATATEFTWKANK